MFLYSLSLLSSTAELFCREKLGQHAHLSQTFKKMHTNKRIADLAGTSVATVKRFRAVKNFGCKDIIGKVMSGDLSINDGYKKVKILNPSRAGNPTLPFVNPQPGKWDNTIWNEDNLDTLPRMAQETPHSVDLHVFDPPWNVGKDYGFGKDADKLPHDQFIADLLKRFPLMAECATVGGKLCCIIEQTTTPKEERDSSADYVRPIDLDLIAGVRELNCGWRLMDRIIFIKPPGASSTAWGAYHSSSCPILRPHWGMVIVWA